MMRILKLKIKNHFCKKSAGWLKTYYVLKT